MTLPLLDPASPLNRVLLPDQPRYLRIVATTACPLRCSFCHAEGDEWTGGSRRLETGVLSQLLEAGAACGIRKFKFLGGEPLLRLDLPVLVAATRRAAPGADISVISSGVAAPDRFTALLDAGLDRVNLSIHGWMPEAFALRGGSRRSHELRRRSLETVLATGRPTKLNYVYGGPQDHQDLRVFLDWAASRPVVVNLLDDLGNPDASWRTLLRACLELRGPWAWRRSEADPDSLATTRLGWDDGLEVEIKAAQIGDIGPWSACRLCPRRSGCREGIFAVRLNHRGELQPCMDRPDFTLPLVPLLERGGVPAVVAAWTGFVDRWWAGSER